jgi:gamma-glutamyl hydrolase
MRVAVVPYNAPDDELVAFADSLNGLLFTGGGLGLEKNTTYYQVRMAWLTSSKRHGFPGAQLSDGRLMWPSSPLCPSQTASKLFDMVKAKNDKGTRLPLWGTCMGFQLLHILAADDERVLELNAFDSEVTTRGAARQMPGGLQPHP